MFQRIHQSVVLFAESQRRALRAQSGQSLVILAFAFLGLIAMLGLALDLGLVYIERVRIKRAVDAATLAGVVELPLEEDAFNRAIEYLNLNGYNIDPLNGDANVYVIGCVRDPATGAYVDYTTPYTYIQVADPRNNFILAAMPAPNTPRKSSDCDADAKSFGNGNRLAITGTVRVNMNFMQFFGFREVPVQDWAIAQNVTNLDLVVVFDISGSMEFSTICADCWVRTDSTNPDYPNNGYYNPIPDAVLSSNLCSADQVPHQEESYKYLIAEAELAAYNQRWWETRYRQTGQGYWAIQRGSFADYWYNRAGDPSQQSSNVCLVPGIDCTAPGNPSDNLCKDDPPSDDVFVDCSAYMSHRPNVTYGQPSPPSELQGMFYYLDDVIDNDPPPPKLEYDFVPDWNGTAHIWIRAQGGGKYSFEPIYADPFILNQSTIHWDATGDAVPPQSNTSALPFNTNYRDTRASPSLWRWIHLGTTQASKDVPFVLRLWPGSPGYDIDKIVVTNDPRTSWSQIAALSYDDPPGSNNNIGRPATPGSATRAACDPCNPIYGLTVTPDQCTGYSPVTVPTNNLANALFNDIEPLRTSQEAVKRFIKRLDPEFDQVGFVAFTDDEKTDRISQLECRKRYGQACYEGTSPISYTQVLKKVEDVRAEWGTNIAWGMREGLRVLGVDSPDNSCTTDTSSCGRGGAATRVMVVLTDGSPNDSPSGCGNDPVYNFPYEIPDSDAYDCVIYYAGKALENNVIIYTIGLGQGARRDLLEMTAETAHGQYFFAPTPEELDAQFDKILSNIYVRLIR
jgi:Flp pilus assembly protein TadG